MMGMLEEIPTDSIVVIFVNIRIEFTLYNIASLKNAQFTS